MITNTKETFTTIGELKQLIASYPDNTEISFLGSLAFIEKNKTDLSLGFVPECRFNIDFSGPKASCEEVLSIFMGVNGQHFGKTFDWETNEMMMTNNDTDMFVSISGDCAWSFHQAFCELHPFESNTTLLELSRRLNLYIEGWGDEDWTRTRERIIYDCGVVEVDETETFEYAEDYYGSR